MRVLAGVILALVAGCMSGDGMQTKLRDTTTDYNRSIRWRDVDRAAEHLPAESQQAFIERHEHAGKNLVVLDYDLTRLDLDKNTGVAASRATIWWHTDDSTIVQETVVDQLWQFHDGQFVLVDERRATGTPLMVFAETAEDRHPWLPGLERYRKAYEIGEANKKGWRARKRRPRAVPTQADLGGPPASHGPPKPRTPRDALADEVVAERTPGASLEASGPIGPGAE